MKINFCPRCGTRVPTRANFCGGCGSALSGMGGEETQRKGVRMTLLANSAQGSEDARLERPAEARQRGELPAGANGGNERQTTPFESSQRQKAAPKASESAPVAEVLRQHGGSEGGACAACGRVHAGGGPKTIACSVATPSAGGTTRPPAGSQNGPKLNGKGILVLALLSALVVVPTTIFVVVSWDAMTDPTKTTPYNWLWFLLLLPLSIPTFFGPLFLLFQFAREQVRAKRVSLPPLPMAAILAILSYVVCSYFANDTTRITTGFSRGELNIIPWVVLVLAYLRLRGR